jgi:hypothetical protein
MEWRDEGGRDSNDSSLARSAWKLPPSVRRPIGTADRSASRKDILRGILCPAL